MMHESVKAILALICAVCLFGAIIVWMGGDEFGGFYRIAFPILGVLTGAGYYKLHFLKDKAPDFLKAITGQYFNRGGFCFAPAVAQRDGICFVDVFFQNQYEGPCVGRIAMRPAREFFLTRPDFDTIACEISCPPGGYGIAAIPLPLPADFQGKRQKFEVGAAVEYPMGRGNQLRFFDGISLRTNTEFKDSFITAARLGMALGGSILLTSPASVELRFPTGCAREIGEMDVKILQLWQMGEPLPEYVTTANSDFGSAHSPP